MARQERACGDTCDGPLGRRKVLDGGCLRRANRPLRHCLVLGVERVQGLDEARHTRLLRPLHRSQYPRHLGETRELWGLVRHCGSRPFPSGPAFGGLPDSRDFGGQVEPCHLDRWRHSGGGESPSFQRTLTSSIPGEGFLSAPRGRQAIDF